MSVWAKAVKDDVNRPKIRVMSGWAAPATAEWPQEGQRGGQVVYTKEARQASEPRTRSDQAGRQPAKLRPGREAVKSEERHWLRALRLLVLVLAFRLAFSPGELLRRRAQRRQPTPLASALPTRWHRLSCCCAVASIDVEGVGELDRRSTDGRQWLIGASESRIHRGCLPVEMQTPRIGWLDGKMGWVQGRG
jgi:hypothetical protein